MAWLVMALFDTSRRHRWAHYYLIIVALAGLGAFLATGGPFYSRSAELLFAVSLPLVFVAMYLAWASYRAGEPAGRIFLLAFCVSTIGATAPFLRILGILPSNLFTLHALQVSSFIHMILMTMGMSERVLDAEERAKRALQSAEQHAVSLAGRMTQRLEASNEALTQTLERERQLRLDQQRFIESISHDYRTPLAVLNTNLDIIRSEGGVGSGRLAVMGQAIRRLRSLFDDALRSRRFGWVPDDENRRVDVGEMLELMVDEFRVLHPECPVSLETPKASIEALGNDRLLRVVLFNLLDNARKYRVRAPDDRGIEVCCHMSDHSVSIAIRNAVEKKSDAPADALMAPFVRGGSEGDESGTGMGLFLVRSAVEQMNGRVWLVEDDPSVFEVLIELSGGAPIE